MSDYTKVFDGAAKDAADATVLGADHDTEFSAIATMSATKANKVSGATNGNIAELDANGDLVDSGIGSAAFAGLTGVLETRLDDAEASDASLTPSNAVTNHVRAGYMQLVDGSQTVAAFDWLTALGSQSTFETFGPTGSGATNIYDELDDIPATATAIILMSEMECTLGANKGTAVLWAAQNGITPATSLGNYQHSLGYESDSGDVVGSTAQFIVPVDANLVFQMAWSETSLTIDTGNIYYKGFIEDIS